MVAAEASNVTKTDGVIHTFLGQRLSVGHAPGVIVSLTDRERTLTTVTCGVAELATGKPFDEHSLIRLSSLSKSFVALVVLQEIERGRLSPQTRIAEALPWCGLRDGQGAVTVHHLLTHTAGLPRGSDASLDPLFAVYQLRKVESAWPPGLRFHYSNDGWKLLGLLLEEVTGQPLEKLIRERVLAPLGMVSSHARIEADQIEALVPGYARRLHGRPLTRHRPLMSIPWHPYAAADGCVAATVSDMCRYARMLLNDGRSAGGRLISPELFAALFRRWADDDGAGWYGYGWWIVERSGWVGYLHPGYQSGSSCMLFLDPARGLAAFAAANGLFDVRTVCEYALAVTAADLVGQPPPRQPRTPSPTRVLGPSDYAGRYAGDGQFEVTVAGAGLRFRSGAVDVLLERVDPVMRPGFTPETFVVHATPFDQHFLEFERSEEGTVIRAYHGLRKYGRVPYPPDDVPLPAGHGVYCGHYRSWNPTISSFTVVGRRGRLWLLDQWRTVPLVQLGSHAFGLGDDTTPERIVFTAMTPHGAARVEGSDGEVAWYRAPN